MRVFTYFAPTLPEAIAQVRAELGPKAVVLSWRSTRGGIEISASAEPGTKPRAKSAVAPPREKPILGASAKQETLAQHFKPEDFLNEPPRPAPVDIVPPAPKLTATPKAAPVASRGTAALLGRQAAAKPVVQQPAPKPVPVLANPVAKAKPPTQAKPNPAPEPPISKPAPSRLAVFWTRAGLTREQAMAMAVSDHAQLRQALSESLSQKLKFEPLEAAPTRPVVLVGPPGAGKTAAVAKLATRALAVGYEALLISVDSERCGGAEQLRAMADRLGTPFETATTLQELSRLTKKARQAGQCVFVDAASASPMQPSDMRATERLVQEVGLEPILCMPADLRYEDLEDLGLAFAEIGTKRAIATRFDLTKRRASAVFALHKSDIALAQISATPFITGGIALASAHRVAALLLEPFDDIKAEDAA
ncbi:FlhF Flagellar GTP-binding protein [Caulobacteraceae bacterium]